MNCNRFWLCLHLYRSASVYSVVSEKGTIPRFEGLYLLLIHADVRFEKVLHCFALKGEANGSQISCDEWERVSVSLALRGERRATYVRALKDKAVASGRRADLHVEGVAFVVELCDAAERIHDLHVLQCHKAVMSHLKMSMWEVDAVHRTFVFGFMTPTPCLLMTTQTWFGQLGSNVCCKGACRQSHWRHAVSFKNLFLFCLCPADSLSRQKRCSRKLAMLQWFPGRWFWLPALWIHSAGCRSRWCAAGWRKNIKKRIKHNKNG